MPDRPVPLTGDPCWIELASSDTAASRAFYEALLGWTSEEAGPEYGGYVSFIHDGEQAAGCMVNTPEMNAPDAWLLYLATADVKATADAATAAGGQILVEPMDVMDLGSMAVLTDPDGAVVGAWQPGTHLGFGPIGSPGAPAWTELHTRDYDTVVGFYRDVFKWDTHTMSDTPELRYTTLGEDDDAKAGIMDSTTFLPEGVPAHWAVYFGVDDVDASVAQAVDLGATIVIPANDTPYGRLVQLTDTTGAMFRLLQPLPPE